MYLKHGLGLLGILVSTSMGQAKLEIHEWGTFTSLVGSNGVTQNGMYHEDEKLPSFVHGFGAVGSLDARPPTLPITPQRPCHGKGCFFNNSYFRSRVITQKMETPVLYFYSDQPSTRVSVNVKFPQGIFTETYPAPVATFPLKSATPVIANGDATFTVDVLNSKSGVLPQVEAGNIYGHARNVASNIVRTGDEQEKFIFYRGLGRFQPGMKITSKDGQLFLRADSSSLPQAAFLVDVDQTGHANVMEIAGMSAGTTTTISKEKIAVLKDHSGSGGVSGVLQPALVTAGLNADEAKAMLDTWNHGYLQVPGLRLLYVLPSNEVEQTLPMTISPKPDALKRVFVGRIEVMLDTDETRILNEIKTHRANFRVASLGRFAEPMLRRVLEVHRQTPVGPVFGGEFVAPDPKVTALIERLILEASGPDAGDLIVQ